jgi:hypothetical protein
MPRAMSGAKGMLSMSNAPSSVSQKAMVKSTAMTRLSLRARSKDGDRAGVMVKTWLMAGASSKAPALYRNNKLLQYDNYMANDNIMRA